MAILDDTRADWNARSPLRPLDRVPWSTRVGVSWHWLGDGRGPNASGSHSKCLEQVRAWQGYHQSSLGWKDIGYNALVCQHARAIEGRGLDVEGSHSPGVNTSHVGVQFMVGSGDPFPTDAMIARAVRLRADLGELAPTIRRDWSHRDDPKAQTACAGNGITEWVHAGGPTKQEDDMPLTDADLAKVADAVWAKQLPKLGNENTTAAGTQLGNAHIYAYRAANGVGSLEATVAAQAAALALLAKGQSIDIAQVQAAINEAVSNFELTLAPKKDVTP